MAARQIRAGAILLAFVSALCVASVGTSLGKAAGKAALGPAPGLCKMNTSRGAVPATFPMDACVDGGGVWIHNTLRIPVRLFLTGSATSPKTIRAANVTLAADAMGLEQGLRATLLAPGQTTFIGVGPGAASVTVANDIAAVNTYVIANGLITLIGAAKLKGATGQRVDATGKADTAAGFVGELTNVFQEYHSCLGTHPGFLTRTKCKSLLTRDIAFAVARFGLKVGSTTVGLFLSAVETVQFAATVNGELNAVSDGERTISIRAVS